MSTDPTAPPSRSFDPGVRYCLDPAVALRAEPFGALAYHYTSRRLTFLRSHQLVRLVGALAGYESVDAALDELVSPAERPSHLKALASLAESGFIRAA